jgi:hypothetical protein
MSILVFLTILGLLLGKTLALPSGSVPVSYTNFVNFTVSIVAEDTSALSYVQRFNVFPIKPLNFDTNLFAQEVNTTKLTTHEHIGRTKSPTAVDVSWHGGPVMLGTIRLYSVWFSNSEDVYSAGGESENTVELLTTFADHLGGSVAFGTAASYTDGGPTKKVSTTLQHKSRRVQHIIIKNNTPLTENRIKTAIRNNINNGIWKLDENAVYVAFFQGNLGYSSMFTNLGKFGLNWCGYHSYFKVKSGGQTYTLKYAVVGDPNYVPPEFAGSGVTGLDVCAAYTSGSVNGNAGADGMQIIIMLF